IALRTLGGTREVCWREYGQQGTRLAATLTDLAVRGGDTGALMMANRIEIHFLDVAIMHLGAGAISLSNTLRPSEIAYILQNSGARIAFAEAIHVAALREATTTHRLLDQIIVIDGAADGAVTLGDVLAEDTTFDIVAAAEGVRPEDLATI